MRKHKEPSAEAFAKASKAKLDTTTTNVQQGELHVACLISGNAVDDLFCQDEIGEFKMHRTKCTAVRKSVLTPFLDRNEQQPAVYVCIKCRSEKHNRFGCTLVGLVESDDIDAEGGAEAVITSQPANRNWLVLLQMERA